MNANDPAPACGRCGGAVAPEADGLCPRCLIALNLVTETDAQAEASDPANTPVVKPPLPPALSAEALAPHFPQFEILECLGCGGMGVVYKARQAKLDRFVALKILLPRSQGASADTAFAQRFAREARALARLNHPNIVAVHDFGEAGGYPFLVMEYVEGVTLRQLLQSRKLSPEEALAIVPKICEALQFAHHKGIVHRDIKPENILLDKSGQMKIADFGIAKVIQPGAPDYSLTGERDVMGTPHYMAPEQIEQPAKVDHRADIFSLGVVFYEMLTGELPLGKFAPPSRKVHVDLRLDEVVLHALEKEPARRYQHVSEVKTDVESIAGSAPVSPAPVAKASDRFVTLNFQSKWAVRVMALTGLAGLGALSRVPGWERWAGFYGFFGCIGLGFLIEYVHRSGHLAGPSAVGIGRLLHQRWADLKWAAIGAAGLCALGIGLLLWLQRPERLDTMIAADSPDGQYSALASTWRAMRVFGPDHLSYRFTVQGRGGAFFENWEVPVPIAELTHGYLVQPLGHYFFAKHGSIRWSADGQCVSFLVRGTEVSALNLQTRSHSSQEGFSREHEVELTANASLEGCFLDLDTGQVLSAPKEYVESLRASGRLAGGVPQVAVIRDWMRSNRVDIVKRSSEKGVLLVDGFAVMLAENTYGRRSFDSVSVEQVLKAVQENNKLTASRSGAADSRMTALAPQCIFAFQTRKGTIGLLEPLESTSPERTRLRYKCVRDSAAGPTGSTTGIMRWGLPAAPSTPARGTGWLWRGYRGRGALH